MRDGDVAYVGSVMGRSDGKERKLRNLFEACEENLREFNRCCKEDINNNTMPTTTKTTTITTPCQQKQ